MAVNSFTSDVGDMSYTWIFHILDMKSIRIHNTGYSDIMYCTSNRTYVEAHKNIWEPIILGFQMQAMAANEVVGERVFQPWKLHSSESPKLGALISIYGLLHRFY